MFLMDVNVLVYAHRGIRLSIQRIASGCIHAGQVANE